MNRLFSIFALALFLVGALLAAIGQGQEQEGGLHVDVITIDGTINPGSSDFILKAIKIAKSDGANALIIELDTPGGLVESTRDIVQGLLNTPVPVVIYVTPAGAHAGSAGVMITLAGNVAVMTPGTNIGAATPVSGMGEMDEAMKKKVTSDVTAWVEGIAEKRGRNKKWAAKTVTEAVSVTATEALRLNVIDYLADSLAELLEKIDGHKVSIEGEDQVLKTKGASVRRIPMGFKHRLLMRLADPNLAYLFMIIGFLGLYSEFSHPGLIFPGVVGGVCLILFLVATQILPINTIGLVLIFASIALFILEVKITSYGALTIGGLVCLTLGSFFLFDVPEKVLDYPDFNLRVSWSYIIPSVLTIAAFVLAITYLVIRTHRRKAETGMEHMVGQMGRARSDIPSGGEGQIDVRGEIWKAEATQDIKKGDKIEVVEATSLLLKIRKHSSEPQ